MIRKAALALAMLPVLAHAIEPLRPSDLPPQQEEERNLWFASRDVNDGIRKSGMEHADPKLQSYVQGVLDRLYPEWSGKLVVRLIDQPDYNAFALPNATLYIHTGLLANLENEAQLATVLGHEAAHVIMRHGLQQKRSVNSTLVFASVVTVVNPLIGLLAQVGGVSSIYGFSRDHEREADRIGFERLAAAGYSLPESVRVFELLDEEARALDVKQPVFFASHPALQERIKSFQELIAKQPAGQPAGDLGRERFLAAIGDLRERGLQMQIGAGRYGPVLALLREGKDLSTYPPYVAFYRGEAYRLRRQDGDDGKALDAYREAIRNAPEFALSYRGVGQITYRQGNKAEAKEALLTYLAHRPDADDRAFIQDMLDTINEETK